MIKRKQHAFGKQVVALPKLDTLLFHNAYVEKNPSFAQAIRQPHHRVPGQSNVVLPTRDAAR